MNCRRCWGVDLRIASTLLMRNGSMTLRIVMLASLFAEIVETGRPCFGVHPNSARTEGGRMRIIGCDLHARQQSLAMLETTTGETVNLALKHEGNEVREFYSELPRPVLVGIEATGSMHWFLKLMEELGIECRAGHPATIRAAARRKQKMIGSTRT